MRTTLRQSAGSRRLIVWMLVGLALFVIVHAVLFLVPHSVHLFR